MNEVVEYFDLGNGTIVFGAVPNGDNVMVSPMIAGHTPDGRQGIAPYGAPIIQLDEKDRTAVDFGNLPKGRGPATPVIADLWRRAVSKIQLASAGTNFN